MINGTVVIEPSDSAIKIVVGNVLNNTPIILYANTIPVNGLIKNGSIVDIKALSGIFHNISHIADKKARIRFDIKSAVLVLPPLGFEVYSDKKTTNVISNESRIGMIDIKNVLLLLNGAAINQNSAIVDIVPLKYYLDRGSVDKIPIGMISKFLAMNALIYTLPKKIVKSYRSSLEIAGIRVKRPVISSYAMAKLLAREKDMPFAYLYVDVGSSYTSITLISKTHVYGSSYFMIGGDELTKKISEAFKIDTKEAEKIKRRYGYDNRLISFDPTIISSNEPEGMEETFTVSDLNQVTREYLENYLYSFDTCLNKLVSSYPEEKRNFPIIIGGAASRLIGFIEYFKEKYPNKNISRVPLNIIGTRHEKYLNCVGALLAMNSTSSVNKEVKTQGENTSNLVNRSNENK